MYVAAPTERVDLKRGDEIVAINGRPVGDIIADVSQYLSVDGWTDHAKTIELENPGGELLASGIDHHWPMLYGWPTRWTLNVRPQGSGSSKSIEAEPIALAQWKALAAQAFPGASNFKDAVNFRMLDESSALLSVSTFVNYREPVDATAKFTPIFQALRDQRTEHLILDLRDCGGGSDDVSAALLSFLVQQPLPPAAPALVRTYRFGELRKHLRTWDQSVFELPDAMFRKLDDRFYEIVPQGREPAAANPLAFTGRLSVLVGPANQSGATILLARLQAQRANTRLIGEATGGSAEGPTAGVIFFLKLPNSEITVRIPGVRSRLSVPFSPGMGVQPDTLVRPTVESWMAGRDLALEAARAR